MVLQHMGQWHGANFQRYQRCALPRPVLCCWSSAQRSRARAHGGVCRCMAARARVTKAQP